MLINPCLYYEWASCSLFSSFMNVYNVTKPRLYPATEEGK